jgi:thiamine-phosphate pyrophosphorylase
VKSALAKALLYGICDLGYLTRDKAVPVSRLLLQGGAGILQLRAKGHDPANLIDLALELKDLCVEFAVPFIVNDHLQLALDSQAHGLHLGQDDGSLAPAREQLKEGVLLGRSTHSLEQARLALAEGADYIGFGPLFPTPTKKGRPGIGMADISRMEAEVGTKIPAFCIGGIKPGNLEAVMESGARRVVIVSHLLTSPDPKSETKAALTSLNRKKS